MPENIIPQGAMRPPTLEEERVRLVPPIKQFRQDVDALIQRVSKSDNPEVVGSILYHGYSYSTLVALAEGQTLLKLIEAKMWAGKMLEGLGNPFPAELADKANVQ